MQKIGAKYRMFFTAAFLAVFALASIFLAFHSFSHKAFGEVSVKEFSQSQPLNKSSSHDPLHCSFCFLSDVQNNIIAAAPFVFVASLISLFLIWRQFDRVKLAYLSSSFLSRAPPSVS